MFLEIVTPDEKIYTGEIEAVKVPGSKGEFEVLENHAAIVSTLTNGTVRVTEKGNNKQFYTISSGVIEVLKNKVVILAESATTQK